VAIGSGIFQRNNPSAKLRVVYVIRGHYASVLSTLEIERQKCAHRQRKCDGRLPRGVPLSEAMIDMILTVLRRLSKRETVTTSGTSRNAQWALVPSLL
jgi:hypothetical protein